MTLWWVKEMESITRTFDLLHDIDREFVFPSFLVKLTSYPLLGIRQLSTVWRILDLIYVELMP